MLFDGQGRPADFVYLDVNDAFARLTGLHDVIGKRVSEVIPGIREAEPELMEAYGRIARGGDPERLEIHFRPLDMWLSISAYSPRPDHFVALFDNVTERKRSEQAHERDRRVLESITRATDVMLVYLDPDFNFVRVNDAYAAACHKRPEDLIGKNHFALYPNEENERIFRRVRESGEPVFFKDKPFEYPDQPERGVTYWDWSLVPVKGSAGSIGGLVFSLRETTKNKQAELALRDADRRKDEFLQVLSHELRNPLAPIRNSVYILQHAAPASEEAARARSIIERQTDHLTRLVDDLLDVTRIARGKIDLRRERLDLREIVLRTAEDLRAVVENRGIKFRVEVPEERRWAEADPTRIAQVIGNLLQNAAKFTRRGDEVTVALRAVDEAAEIVVRDTGAGIEPALLPELFQPFVQGQRTLARTEGGLGLGLALVKGITELHGGTVRVESAGKGAGAEFVIRLPLAAPAPARKPVPARIARKGPRRRVLVVDDNRDAAESLAELVETLGHTSEVALDGPTAIAKARACSPDVVLCDIGLPGMCGYDVARALRSHLSNGVLLVALTGYALPADLKSAVEAGFDRHLAKPASASAIEQLLG
jgi:PAS domain S-box-containing protein